MVSKAISVVLFVASAVQIAFTALPSLPLYQSKTAQEKQELLWTEISQNPFDLQNLPQDTVGLADLVQLFVPTFLAKAFTWVSDEMILGRPKLIHTHGTVCKARLTFRDNPYTGMFRSNSSHPVIIRASLGKYEPTNFIPGAAVKILLDGRPSVNWFTLFSLDGQGANFNYFANPLPTTIPAPRSFALKILSRIFKMGLLALPGGASDRPPDENNSPVYEHAAVNEHSDAVYAPYRVTLVPNSALGWDPANRTDYRVKLAELPAGVRLWDVAVRRYDESEEVVIGDITTESQFVASQYGDRNLYFQHPSKPWKS